MMSLVLELMCLCFNCVFIFQVDYLQQKNHDLQVQVDSALSKASLATNHTLEADIKNTELNHELQNVDRMAQQLQLDKDAVVRTADMQLSDASVSGGGGWGTFRSGVLLADVDRTHDYDWLY